MPDIADKKTRSRMMSNIHGKNTRPEVTVRKALHARGLRYRLHDKKLPGSPDLSLPKYRVAIFVHGCYWHRHAGCAFCTMPATNTEFWVKKFHENVARDQRNILQLGGLGWRVAIIWECATRSSTFDRIVDEIEMWVREDLDSQAVRIWPLADNEGTELARNVIESDSNNITR